MTDMELVHSLLTEASRNVKQAMEVDKQLFGQLSAYFADRDGADLEDADRYLDEILAVLRLRGDEQ